MKCKGKLTVITVGVTLKRRKPVSTRKKFKITSFNYENSCKISVGVKGNSLLKFYPNFIYKHPVKHSFYRSVIQWHVGYSLYKLSTDIPFDTIIDLLDS